MAVSTTALWCGTLTVTTTTSTCGDTAIATQVVCQRRCSEVMHHAGERALLRAAGQGTRLIDDGRKRGIALVLDRPERCVEDRALGQVVVRVQRCKSRAAPVAIQLHVVDATLHAEQGRDVEGGSRPRLVASRGRSRIGRVGNRRVFVRLDALIAPEQLEVAELVVRAQHPEA